MRQNQRKNIFYLKRKKYTEKTKMKYQTESEIQHNRKLEQDLTCEEKKKRNPMT